MVVGRGVLPSLNEEFPVLLRCLYLQLFPVIDNMVWWVQLGWDPRKSTFLGVSVLGTQAQPFGPAWKVKSSKIILACKPANLNCWNSVLSSEVWMKTCLLHSYWLLSLQENVQIEFVFPLHCRTERGVHDRMFMFFERFSRTAAGPELSKACLTQECCTLLLIAILVKAANNHTCWCAMLFFWEHQRMEEEIQITDTEYEATRMFSSSDISA